MSIHGLRPLDAAREAYSQLKSRLQRGLVVGSRHQITTVGHRPISPSAFIHPVGRSIKNDLEYRHQKTAHFAVFCSVYTEF